MLPSDVQLQTPDTAERRKLAIVHEVLYGEGKVRQLYRRSICHKMLGGDHSACIIIFSPVAICSILLVSLKLINKTTDKQNLAIHSEKAS